MDNHESSTFSRDLITYKQTLRLISDVYYLWGMQGAEHQPSYILQQYHYQVCRHVQESKIDLKHLYLSHH